MHHFFETYGLGETGVHLYCDNCLGQNENRYVLWYMAWRVMRGLHSEISLHFMPPGHTKFSPDWCFGLLKKCFKVNPVFTLDELKLTVLRSTRESQINIPQLTGNEKGEVFVPTYDWSKFFRGFTALDQVKSFYQFNKVFNMVSKEIFKKVSVSNF